MTARQASWLRVLLGGVLLALLLIAIPNYPVIAQDKGDQVVITYFWGDGCPHCAKAKPFLAGLEEKYPGQVTVDDYEVWYSRVNQQLMQDTAEKLGVDVRGVPFIVIGERYWEGFDDNNVIGAEIEAYVDALVKNLPPPAPVDPDVITLPLIGQINLSNQSALISTLLIAFVDGFNPCSLWVLTMLLALTLHTGDRKKVILIGVIFLTVTAAIYAAFIAGLFTLLSFVSFLGWIQVVVALVALFFGLVNVKDYFWYKEGLSFTIDDKEKPGIAKRIRNLMDASHSTWGLISGTVVLAAGVSLVEFACTAGFPVLWTNLLTAQGVTAGAFVGLLLVYLVIYQVDELVIFFGAVFSLKATRVEEKHGRILKLIGGTLMLTLAVIMIVSPALMNRLSSSLIIFGSAFGLALLILLLHRVILPKFGIWIGTEQGGRGKRKGKKIVKGQTATKRH
jgi:thiol-disulfide isomerase/thioredoxin